MISKSKFKDAQGRFLTGSLFLEVGYDVRYALYTLDDHDREYQGKSYPSIKRLYLEERDPTEYRFGIKHFYSYEHWERICTTSKLLRTHVDKWRRELRVMLRSEGVRAMVSRAKGDKACTAAKWLAEGKFDLRGPGAPSKIEREAAQAEHEHLMLAVGDDLKRIKPLLKQVH